MGRARTPIGQAGESRVYTLTRRAADGTETVTYQARARFRDGVLRTVTATGRSETAARPALRRTIAARSGLAGQEITGRTTFGGACDIWLAMRRRESAEGRPMSRPQTVDREELAITNDVKPGLGDLALEELTVGICDRFVQAISATGRKAKARQAGSTLTKVLDWAVRKDALRENPAAATDTVWSKPKAPRPSRPSTSPWCVAPSPSGARTTAPT
ncbi:phage integrase central domain-containing protein [Cellulosimicrobium cellulans]|uniref:phage integrase central domain-containing protein n=1 Tax=Cellulosimicrobium cellulans TaxID=1710 RepID=UPI00380D23B3